jgi:hypothetical protein
VTLLNPTPNTVTSVPTGPLLGLKLLIPGLKVNVPVLTALPAAFDTVILPVVVPTGTATLIDVALTTVMPLAAVPLNDTEVALPIFAPLIVTNVPNEPLVGEKLLMVGGSCTVKLVVDVTVTPALTIDILPVVAVFGTVAVIWLLLFTVKAAEILLKRTAVTLVNELPVITTLEPRSPLVGLKLLMAGTIVKLARLVELLTALVAVILPVVAPTGTLTRMEVADTTVMAEAGVPLNETLVALLILLPLSVTVAPIPPDAGENEERVKGSSTV